MIRIGCVTSIVGDGCKGCFFVKWRVGRVGDGIGEGVSVALELVVDFDEEVLKNFFFVQFDTCFYQLLYFGREFLFLSVGPCGHSGCYQ